MTQKGRRMDGHWTEDAHRIFISLVFSSSFLHFYNLCPKIPSWIMNRRLSSVFHNCKNLPVHLPEADCSLFTRWMDGWTEYIHCIFIVLVFSHFSIFSCISSQVFFKREGGWVDRGHPSSLLDCLTIQSRSAGHRLP